jgi:M6 family metalloprotease-like protein
MNKKILLMALCAFFCQLTISPVFAVKATPFPITITQPDGTQLTIRLHGSEFKHYQTTTDGYILKVNSKGFYTYATVSSTGDLVESNVIAKNPNKRTASEIQFLKTIDQSDVLNVIQNTAQKSKMMLTGANQPRRAYPLNGSPKALVILANFKDKKFTVSNPKTSFQNLVTQSGYNANGGTGSAKDYFMASTYGKFAPDFIVTDTVTLPHTLDYYGKNDSIGNDTNDVQMIVDACAAANAAGLDFTQFDTDGDGYIDNVFVYYAGYNEAEGGPANTIWPKRWGVYPSYNYTGTVASITFDGKQLKDFSCTSELKGTSGTNMCGVGTFCHEFGHVLGLPDYYDTSGSSTYKATLETWEIMDYGPYLNGGNTPPSYSAWDRFFLGFFTPQQISTPSDITLQPLYLGTTPPANTIGQAYLIAANSSNLNGAAPSPAEFFLVEYRKHTGWDTYLGQDVGSIGTSSNIPSDGMCIWHIDYLQSDWDNNQPNNYTGSTQTASSHMRVYLQPLSGQTTTPGTTFTTGSFTPTTWSGTNLNSPITSIAMTTNNMTFKFMGGTPVFGPFSALPATNVTATSFTANWGAATNATKYLLNVYKKSTTSGTPVTETTGFDNFPTTVPTGWSSSVTTTYTSSTNYGASSPSVKLGVNGASITTAVFSNAITSVSFWIKGQGTDASSSLLVEGSTNGSSWASIQTLNSLPTTGTTKTIAINTSLGYKVLRFTYTKSAGNLAIDDIAVTYGGSTTTKTMVLTDQEVTTGTSCSVTGLSPDNYYYTVKASNGTDVSAESNEITVSITSDVTVPEENKTELRPVVGGIEVVAPKDEKLRIYDITGSLVKEQQVPAGFTNISLAGGRIYIVRIASFNTKIVVK